MNIRLLLLSDYYKGYLSLLKQLSEINSDMTYDDFKDKWLQISNNIYHQIYVIEIDNKIVASGTILVEPKFIRNSKFAGHIEDIVVDEKYRGNGLSKIVMNKLLEVAKELECYRVTLNCQESKLGLYQKFGFSNKSLGMRVDIRDDKNIRV